MRATWISTISSNTPRKQPSYQLLHWQRRPRSCFCFHLRNGTLIICMPWIIEGPWIQAPNAVACLHSSLFDLLSCSKMSTIKTSFFPTWRLFFEWKTWPRCLNWTLDFEPAFLRGFSPSCAHDPFFRLLSGFPFKSRDFQFQSLPVPVTSFPVMWLPLEPTILMVRGVTRGNLTTNQKPEQGVCMQITVGNFAQWASFTTFDN